MPSYFNGDRKAFSTKGVGKLDIYVKKKKKLNCSLAPHNILLETYHGLKHKNNNYNSLDTNIGEYIYFGFGKDFLKREQKHTT